MQEASAAQTAAATNELAMDAESLRKCLEKELSLDARDLRSHAWYHGSIPRQRAEEIIGEEEGGFLVRDCTSQPGNFVLTCRTKHQTLHFVINKVVLHPDTVYEKIQYQFEDEAFDTVPDLITFYVGSERPITASSDARIRTPKNRMYPLSFYSSRYHHYHHHHYHHQHQQHHLSQSIAMTTRNNSGISVQPPMKPELQLHQQHHFHQRDPLQPPRLPSKKQRSQSLTPSEAKRVSHEKCSSSADGVIRTVTLSSSTLLIANNNNDFSSSATVTTLPRSPSRRRPATDSSVSPCGESRLLISEMTYGTDEINSTELNALPPVPPPKPSRTPTISCRNSGGENKDFEGCFLPANDLQRMTSYHASGSDSGNGSGDSALSSAAGDSFDSNHTKNSGGVVIKYPRYQLNSSESTVTLTSLEFNYKEVEERLLESYRFEVTMASKIDLENFHTLLLPVGENKPLDSQVLKGIKMILSETGSRILANHLTSDDLDIVFSDENECRERKYYGTDITLLLLPHGSQLRKDLLERTNCLKLLVAVTILTCADESERTETLNKWIEVAIETKMALGNLYGFCGIMLGLCLTQVQKLEATWHTLRQRYTDAAFNFEAKLRPTLKSMDNCSNPQAPNTTIPHLLPFILLLEDRDDSENDDGTCTDEERTEDFPSESIISARTWEWESGAQDFGLSVLHAHLDAARKCAELSATFRRNAKIALADAKLEELTLDLFKTEFQMKFLWGSQGARAGRYERYSKFEKVLDLMVEKHCNRQSNPE